MSSSESVAKYRKKILAEGRCAWCGKTREHYKTLCNACNEKRNEYTRNKYGYKAYEVGGRGRAPKVTPNKDRKISKVEDNTNGIPTLSSPDDRIVATNVSIRLPASLFQLYQRNKSRINLSYLTTEALRKKLDELSRKKAVPQFPSEETTISLKQRVERLEKEIFR